MSQPSSSLDPPAGVPEPTPQVVLSALLLWVGLHLAAGPIVRLSEWRVDPLVSHGWMEAASWRAGRLDLPARGPNPQIGHDRPRDTAYVDGRVYNVFPPLFTMLSYGAMVLQSWQGEPPEAEFYPPWYVGLVALPLPLVGFWAFRQVTGRSAWAAVLTAYWILGTPLLKMLANCRLGETNELNHVLSNTGLMLLAGDLLGRRRIWPAAIGLVIGMWTRQLTAFYLVGAIWIAWAASRSGVMLRMQPTRRKGLVILGLAGIVGLGTLGALNALKFGSVLDSGYSYIYKGRGDLYAQRAREAGLFDVGFIPRNAYYMNLALPDVRWSRMNLLIGGGDDADGTSIWLTCPLLLLAFRDARRWWQDPARRALMVSSLGVILGVLCYHNTGSVQHGFHRFSLDFVPVWLMVIAPYTLHGRRPSWTLAALAYSVLYFNVLCRGGA
mgnify:CR=1 FL=1